MNVCFSDLQDILSEWPSSQLLYANKNDSLLDRICQILSGKDHGVEIFKNDLQPLFRQLLLRESLKNDHRINIRVPAYPPWPTVREWASTGVSAMTIGTDALLLAAEAWHPTWLGGSKSGVFEDAFSEKYVREEGLCPADPFITVATGYKHYFSPGQRESIRAAFLMPPGHTLIVNLPTGTGKSLVGQAPTLVHPQDGNLTLFVVPTVALAIDQARQMGKCFRDSGITNQTWPLAWYGSLPEADRKDIRRRMHEGTQRILFTSPEALTTSLLRTVFDVTRNGMLRYLVIDEAHLVTQWGDEFRPAFQALSGLRNSLLAQVGGDPFRTLLLSATFTTETVETLSVLFGPPDCVQMVSAVHLRPEPQYWVYRASSPTDKEERILEALKHAPRPFILYVTTRNDALMWHRILKDQAGYRRLERFDGTTPNQKREVIIRDWITNKLDGIVATSAFGVGIDKGDVRTIIHATIPETLDRFYQEVGRGGRDGKTSISLLVYDDSDWTIPEGLATPALISNELGFARWRALYDSRASDVHNGFFRVNIEAIRQGLKGSNDENVKWNMRTLLLMSRAGFLELGVEPNTQSSDDQDEFSPSSPLSAMAVVRIRTLRDDHLLLEAWEKVVSPSREKTFKASGRNLKLMHELLNKNGEVAATLADLYRINTPYWSVDVTQVCGGCPCDRFNGKRKDRYHVPVAVPIHNIVQANLVRWKSTFPYVDPRFAMVFYESETPRPSIISFLRWLISECGVQELCADDRSAMVQSSEWYHLYRHSPSGVVIHRNCKQIDEEPCSALARVTYFDNQVNAQDIQQVLLLQRPFHLVLLPYNTPDPNNSLRRLSDIMTNSAHLRQLNEVINQ